MQTQNIPNKVSQSIIDPVAPELASDLCLYGEATIKLKCNLDGALIAERVPPADQLKEEQDHKS